MRIDLQAVKEDLMGPDESDDEGALRGKTADLLRQFKDWLTVCARYLLPSPHDAREKAKDSKLICCYDIDLSPLPFPPCSSLLFSLLSSLFL
jgi:hypothetical protein